MVKNLPVMREAWVQSLGWEDSPGEAGKIPLLGRSLGCENLLDIYIYSHVSLNSNSMIF